MYTGTGYPANEIGYLAGYQIGTVQISAGRISGTTLIGMYIIYTLPYDPIATYPLLKLKLVLSHDKNCLKIRRNVVTGKRIKILISQNVVVNVLI